jgi:hypothetical protein
MGGQFPFPSQSSPAGDVPSLTIRARPRAEFLRGPLLEKESERRAAINQDQPATIYVADNPKAKANFFGSLDGYGRAVVNYHDAKIKARRRNREH